jgi:hypothetical protein
LLVFDTVIFHENCHTLFDVSVMRTAKSEISTYSAAVVGSQLTGKGVGVGLGAAVGVGVEALGAFSCGAGLLDTPFTTSGEGSRRGGSALTVARTAALTVARRSGGDGL